MALGNKLRFCCYVKAVGTEFMPWELIQLKLKAVKGLVQDEVIAASKHFHAVPSFSLSIQQIIAILIPHIRLTLHSPVANLSDLYHTNTVLILAY